MDDNIRTKQPCSGSVCLHEVNRYWPVPRTSRKEVRRHKAYGDTTNHQTG